MKKINVFVLGFGLGIGSFVCFEKTVELAQEDNNTKQTLNLNTAKDFTNNIKSLKNEAFYPFQGLKGQSNVRVPFLQLNQ